MLSGIREALGDISIICIALSTWTWCSCSTVPCMQQQVCRCLPQLLAHDMLCFRPPLSSLQSPDPALAVLEGPQFRALVLKPDGSTDLDAFLALWPHLRVMARCTPADKYTLVQVGRRDRGQCRHLDWLIKRHQFPVCGPDMINNTPPLHGRGCFGHSPLHGLCCA